MSHVTHWTPIEANGAIAAHHIVNAAGDQANAATDLMIGVSGSRAVADDETVEVAIAGIADVKLGGAVAAGDLLTANSDGEAITTTTAANRVIGIAMKAGVDGDIGEVLISPGIV